MAVGKCKTCGHEPVAQGAKYCPKCGESDPNPSNFWGIVVLVVVGRCCTTLTVEDSQRESMRLDGLHEQAIPRPLPHDKLVQLHCLALQARFAVDLAGQGHDLALAA